MFGGILGIISNVKAVFNLCIEGVRLILLANNDCGSRGYCRPGSLRSPGCELIVAVNDLIRIGNCWICFVVLV